MSKDTLVKIGTGVGLMVGLTASRGEVNAQEQVGTDNPTAVPSVEITPAIEIASYTPEATRAIPVPTFEVPLGLAVLVDGQMQEAEELSIPASSFIEMINQSNPDPETVSRFEGLLATFELLANDRLQDPANPGAAVDAVDTFIEFNRGEDGIVRGSIYAQVLTDGLVSRDDGTTPIRVESMFTFYNTSDGTRQELGIMIDNDGPGNGVTLDIDLMRDGEQLTGVVIKELNGAPISILTENTDGTSQETGALEGSVSAPDGVNFRNLTGEPIGNLPFGTEMVILPEARPIPGQESLGNFYEVLVGNQVGLVSAENLATQQNFDADTLTGVEALAPETYTGLVAEPEGPISFFAGPGISYGSAGTLQAGEARTYVARTQEGDRQWLAFDNQNGQRFWVPADYFTDINETQLLDLPIVTFDNVDSPSLPSDFDFNNSVISYSYDSEGDPLLVVDGTTFDTEPLTLREVVVNTREELDIPLGVTIAGPRYEEASVAISGHVINVNTEERNGMQMWVINMVYPNQNGETIKVNVIHPISAEVNTTLNGQSWSFLDVDTVMSSLRTGLQIRAIVSPYNTWDTVQMRQFFENRDGVCNQDCENYLKFIEDSRNYNTLGYFQSYQQGGLPTSPQDMPLYTLQGNLL